MFGVNKYIIKSIKILNSKSFFFPQEDRRQALLAQKNSHKGQQAETLHWQWKI